jgi:hypothetical protein
MATAAPPNSPPSRLEADGSVFKILQYSEMECLNEMCKENY